MGFEGSIIDIGLHFVTLLIASLIFYLSIKAYRRRNNWKFFLISCAFGLFTLKELLITFRVVWGSFSGLSAISHLLNLGIILALFYGVLR